MVEDENNQKGIMYENFNLSMFGIGFTSSAFNAFLAWTGVVFYTSLSLIGLTLMALARDVNLEPISARLLPMVENARLQESILPLCGLCVFVASLPYLVMNISLRKRNKEKNLKKVTTTLIAICYVNAFLMMMIFGANILIFFISPPQEVKSIGMVISVPYSVFYSILLHGLRTKQSDYLKAFIQINYLLFGCVTFLISIGSVYYSVTWELLSLVVIGAFSLLVLTFLYILHMGYYVSLHIILLNNEYLRKKNSAFVNQLYEK